MKIRKPSVKCLTVTQSVDLDLIIREVDMTGGFMYTTKPLEAAYISGDRGGGGEARVSRLIVDGGSGFPLDLENLEKWEYTWEPGKIMEISWDFLSPEKWEPCGFTFCFIQCNFVENRNLNSHKQARAVSHLHVSKWVSVCMVGGEGVIVAAVP